MAEVIDRVELSGIVKVRDIILKLEKPFRLESGEPSFDVPEHIKEAMVRALRDNQTHYVASAGIPELRKAISPSAAPATASRWKAPPRPSSPTAACTALYCLFRALLEPGDEVLIPDPTWTCVQHLITLCGGVVRRVPLHEERGWTFDPDGAARRDHPAHPRADDQLAAQPHGRRAEPRRPGGHRRHRRRQPAAHGRQRRSLRAYHL